MNDKRELSKNQSIGCIICIIILFAIVLGIGLGWIPMIGPVEEDPSGITTTPILSLPIIIYSLFFKLS